jgi:hypothetical protein
MKNEKTNLKTLRGEIWKILLRIDKTKLKFYLELINEGPCSSYHNIVNDTFRTFTQNLVLLYSFITKGL